MSNLSHFQIRVNEPLNIWDGVRALAMMWVVIGHCYFFSLFAGPINITDFLAPASHPFFLIVPAGLLSVDVFLALGGFFLAFVLLRQKKIEAKTCLLGVAQRALRIWPAYIVAMLFFDSLLMSLGSGMLWDQHQGETKFCSTMWKDILFISNFVDKGSQSCLSWGWYLQVDFQLFICGLLLIYIYSKRKWVFLLLLSVLIVFSSIFVYVYTLVNNIKIYADITEVMTDSPDFYTDVYIKPYGRGVAYLIGLLFGVLYMEHRSIFGCQSR